MENRIWGDEIGNLPVRCWRFKAFVRCDPRSLWLVIIPKSLGPVHGATTHESSTTMSLYGYGLT
jgi:hypothetical protein